MNKANKKAIKKQDQIFKKMSADKKIELAAQLWLLGVELSKTNIHGINRSKEVAGKNSQYSRTSR